MIRNIRLRDLVPSKYVVISNTVPWNKISHVPIIRLEISSSTALWFSLNIHLIMPSCILDYQVPDAIILYHKYKGVLYIILIIYP